MNGSDYCSGFFSYNNADFIHWVIFICPFPVFKVATFEVCPWSLWEHKVKYETIESQTRREYMATRDAVAEGVKTLEAKVAELRALD